MGKVAFVFAGQGAQYPGMGRELYEASPAARDVMDRSERLHPGIREMCFSGTAEELAITKNTQPCLFTVDLMCAAALAEQGVKTDMCAGFSLGEVAAAAFAGVLSFETAFAFILERAGHMQRCAEAVPGFMAAVLRMDNEAVSALCAGLEQVYPVNYNAPGQVVVSGAAPQKEAFLQAVAERGGRAMVLKVGGAFHSPLMGDAARELKSWLAQAKVKAPSIPLYANRTAEPYGPEGARLLWEQVDHPVLWEQSVRHMAAAGADTFVELGPGTVLSGLIRKIVPDAAVCHVEDSQSLQAAAALFKGGFAG